MSWYTNKQFDAFYQGYVETSLWAETDGEEPLDENCGPADMSPGTWLKMRADCAAFLEKAEEDLKWLVSEGYDDFFKFGHNFWLTRNGHGAGFWDGSYPEEAGSMLTAYAKGFGNVDLYVGDDGKIYQSP